MRAAGRVLPRFPHIRPPRLAIVKIARSVLARVDRHNLIDVAATAAFWLLLAVFPFIFFVVSLITLLLGREGIDAVVDLVLTLAPGAVQDEVQHYVQAVLAKPSGTDAIVAIVLALWSASGGAVALGDALNRANGLERDARSFLRRRLQAVTAVGISTLFLAVAVAFVALAPKLVDRIFGAVGLGELAAILFRVLRWPVALVFAVLAWSLAYRVLPCKQSFTLVSPGALVGIPLWILASVGFSFYVAHFGDYGTAYGSLGSAVTFLLWSWLSTLILLVGGEVNAVVRELGGKA